MLDDFKMKLANSKLNETYQHSACRNTFMTVFIKFTFTNLRETDMFRIHGSKIVETSALQISQPKYNVFLLE